MMIGPLGRTLAVSFGLGLVPALSSATVVRDPLPPQSTSTHALGQWVDRQHQLTHDQLQRTATWLDRRFGYITAEQARARLRVLIDDQWVESTGHNPKLRVRGSLRLPNANKRLRLVFGDDRLDDEPNNALALAANRVAPRGALMVNPLVVPAPLTGASPASTARFESLRENNSVALRWFENKSRRYDADLDLGMRSGFDVYVRGKLARRWFFSPQTSLFAQQMARYGAKSHTYAQTDVNLDWHKTPFSPLVALQSTVIFSDLDKRPGVYWAERLGHYYVWDPFGVQLSYGAQLAGRLGQHTILNQYGPWISYRQPFLRNWFFIRGDLNYFDDKLANQNHRISAFLRLETIF